MNLQFLLRCALRDAIHVVHDGGNLHLSGTVLFISEIMINCNSYLQAYWPRLAFATYQCAKVRMSPVKIVGTKKNSKKRFNADTEDHCISKNYSC